MLERKQLKGRAQVTFVLPEDTPAGPLRLAGDPDHRSPTAHPLQPRGTRTRTHAPDVSVPTCNSHTFRYLAAGDYWFNDAQADHHDGTNNLIHT
ncbi:hypothetical protein [Streptomyces sp. SPB4]|uniref:hypothetical protein n=1 Tax=Streptomyces TaxID=1883 RepID=UPI002474DD66|nr:hypothetical protein [Streptomyces sp. SPB4]MDH6544065.1 hypothetical protein [Streptomyces sp. SPB4]